MLQKLDALLDDAVAHADDLLGQVLDEGQEAALGVKPGEIKGKSERQTLIYMMQGQRAERSQTSKLMGHAEVYSALFGR